MDITALLTPFVADAQDTIVACFLVVAVAMLTFFTLYQALDLFDINNLIQWRNNLVISGLRSSEIRGFDKLRWKAATRAQRVVKDTARWRKSKDGFFIKRPRAVTRRPRYYW